MLTLQPLPAAAAKGFRAVLAFGADACDPVLGAAEVDDVLEALALAPDLVARAEERWRTQRRYPDWRPSAGTGSQSRASRATAPARPPTPPAPAAWPSTAESPEAAAAPGRQPAEAEALPGGALPPPPAADTPAATAAPEPARFARVATTAQLPLFGE